MTLKSKCFYSVFIIDHLILLPGEYAATQHVEMTMEDPGPEKLKLDNSYSSGHDDMPLSTVFVHRKKHVNFSFFMKGVQSSSVGEMVIAHQ